MTDHTELLARHREQWSGKQHHGLTFGDLNTLIEQQAAAIRQLQSDYASAAAVTGNMMREYAEMRDKLSAERAAHDATELRLEQTVAKLNHETMAHDDLKRSILDGSHPNLILERKAREEAENQLLKYVDYEEQAAPSCTCGNPTALYVVHRIAAPCFTWEDTDEAQQLEGMEQAVKFLDKYCWVVSRRTPRDEIKRRTK